MKPLLTRILAIPPAAAAASGIWSLAQVVFYQAFVYAFVITALGLLLIPLPASYAFKSVGGWVRVVALSSLGALAGAFVLTVISPPLKFFEPGFWCGGIGTFLWATFVAMAEKPTFSRYHAAKNQ